MCLRSKRFWNLFSFEFFEQFLYLIFVAFLSLSLSLMLCLPLWLLKSSEKWPDTISYRELSDQSPLPSSCLYLSQWIFFSIFFSFVFTGFLGLFWLPHKMNESNRVHCTFTIHNFVFFSSLSFSSLLSHLLFLFLSLLICCSLFSSQCDEWCKLWIVRERERESLIGELRRTHKFSWMKSLSLHERILIYLSLSPSLSNMHVIRTKNQHLWKGERESERNF